MPVLRYLLGRSGLAPELNSPPPPEAPDQRSSAAAAAPAPTSSATSATPPQSPMARQARQLGLYMVGAGFLAASVAVTRRSVVRLRTATVPPFYVSNRAPISSDDKGLIAVRALGLASLNVFSFGVMLVGGLSWAFDLSSVADLRERTRASLAAPLPGIKSGDEDEVERELDNMLDTLYDKLGMTRPDQEERYQRILLQKQHEEEQAVAASKDASEDGNTKA